MSTIPIYALVDTWDNVGTTFKGIALNVTDTASASGSLLMDLKTNTGGAPTTRFTIDKNGSVLAFGLIGRIGGQARLDASGLVLSGASSVSWGDLFLLRDAANTLAQRNGTNAQAFRVYGTYTDGSNSRRLVMTMSAAGVAEIKPEGLGTGLTGNVLHISGLPTSNPGAGILWNNGGTVEVGT